MHISKMMKNFYRRMMKMRTRKAKVTDKNNHTSDPVGCSKTTLAIGSVWYRYSLRTGELEECTVTDCPKMMLDLFTSTRAICTSLGRYSGVGTFKEEWSASKLAAATRYHKRCEELWVEAEEASIKWNMECSRAFGILQELRAEGNAKAKANRRRESFATKKPTRNGKYG